MSSSTLSSFYAIISLVNLDISVLESLIYLLLLYFENKSLSKVIDLLFNSKVDLFFS